MNGGSGGFVVRAALGQTLAAVAISSTYPFDFSNLQDDDLITISRPIEFRYTGPHGFGLPPTRFIALTVTAALVTSIELSPQLDYLDGPAALELTDRTISAVESAGWVVMLDTAGVVGRQELSVLMASPSIPEETSWHVGHYACGDARLLMRLRRTSSVDVERGSAHFLLNLAWRDDALAARADRIAATLRRMDGLPADRWRHVNLAQYEPRVIQALRNTP